MAIEVIAHGGLVEMRVGENRELALGERVPVHVDKVTGLLWYTEAPDRIPCGVAVRGNAEPSAGCVFVELPGDVPGD